jgi:hypothetical protein
MSQGAIEDEGAFTTMDVVSADGFRKKYQFPAHRSRLGRDPPRRVFRLDRDQHVPLARLLAWLQMLRR